MTHAMQVAYARAPSIERIHDQCALLSRSALQDMESSTLVHGCAPLVSELARKLLDDTDAGALFLNICFDICDGLSTPFTTGQDFILPSHLQFEFSKNGASFLANISLRNALLDNLSTFVEVSNQVGNLFLSSYMRKFSKKLLAFIIRCIVQGADAVHMSLNNRYAVTKQSTDSIDFIQTLHYIGGANVKSVLRTGLRLKASSEQWQKVIVTIRQRFLVSELAVAPDSELMAWTECQDRGKLCKISEVALDFFVHLGKTVKPLERLDGSLYLDEVFEKVCESPSVLIRWDEIIKGSLSEEESFKLLHALCNHFCVTWRNGIVSRRLDELSCTKSDQKHGTKGVGFRQRLG